MVIAPARRAGNLSSNPGPGENFSLKLLMYDLSEGYSKAKIPSKLMGKYFTNLFNDWDDGEITRR